MKTLTGFDGHLVLFLLAMKKGSEQKLSKAKMPLSSHFSGPSPLMSSMRSRSLSPLIGSETPPFHAGGQWSVQAELTEENTMPLDSQHHKGTAKNVSALTRK